MTRGHRRPVTASGALPDDDDILSEILVRLPPQPSSLPRASLVCKRWRRLVTDPQFRRLFRARHRNPPLLGVFEGLSGHPYFRSVMPPPDLIPAERFRARLSGGREGEADDWRTFGCRHGRVLLYNHKQKEIVVWDPSTGDQRSVAVPPEFCTEEKFIWNGAVLCSAAGHRGHVHVDFSSCPFKVILVGVTSNHTRAFACSYSSETGKWDDIGSIVFPFPIYCFSNPGTLVGNALYWSPLGHGHGILEFDVDTNNLSVIEWPSGANAARNGTYRIMAAKDGTLGLAILSGHGLQMWERKICSEGVAKWMLRKTEEFHKILGLSSVEASIVGYADDINLLFLFLWCNGSIYMLQLDSLQSTKLWETNIVSPLHPYTSIHDSGI